LSAIGDRGFERGLAQPDHPAEVHVILCAVPSTPATSNLVALAEKSAKRNSLRATRLKLLDSHCRECRFS